MAGGARSIGLGSDDAGAALRAALRRHLGEERGLEVVDYGTDAADPAYPEIARTVAERVADGTHERAILICGTGIGVSIAANKVPGVFAALCHDTYSARRARKSNDAQVLTMGARVIGTALALEITDAWLESEFEGGRSAPKVESLRGLDRQRHA